MAQLLRVVFYFYEFNMNKLTLDLLKEVDCSLSVKSVPRSMNLEIFKSLSQKTGISEKEISEGILFNAFFYSDKLTPIFFVDKYDFSHIKKETAKRKLTAYCKEHNIFSKNVLLWIDYSFDDLGIADFNDVIKYSGCLCYFISDLLIIEENFKWIIGKRHCGTFFYIEECNYNKLL